MVPHGAISIGETRVNMDRYQKLRKDLLDSNQVATTLIKKSEMVLGSSTSALSQGMQTCGNIERDLLDHIIRVAVVGAIKSGKSTLINALLGDDYLKRGAGVVTSIVTRVRKGEQLRARLFLKSWDEVNREIEEALVLFPAEQWQTATQRFDIRRNADRQQLADALGNLDAELRIAQDQLNANSVLLSSYLKGYEQVKDLVKVESVIQEFDQNRFGAHRDFVGQDALAVYLKDIELEITGDMIGANMEIADCQGSDSPNPLHMAMIQDYLLKAHLILYVISSRTGVRQADIRFLSMIKRMGIGENMLFVCNFDFNEHDSLDELKTLNERVREEIALIIPEPVLFTLSALYNLFAPDAARLSDKDSQRLDQWHQAGELVAFSASETSRLAATLDRKLNRERSALLLQNQLERLDVICSGLQQWIRMNRDLLRRDAGDAHHIAERVKQHQDYVIQVQSMIQSTLDGATQKIKNDLRKSVDRFFDNYSGPILKKTVEFVRNYAVDLSRYQDHLSSAGFSQTLYSVFQEYKQAVDTFMAEKINPEIIGFIGRQETQLKDYYHSVAAPYEGMVREALERYDRLLAQFGFTGVQERWTFNLSPDLEALKQRGGVSLQPAATVLRYSANIRTEAIIRLGAYSLVRLVRKLLKKNVLDDKSEQIKALRDGIRRMKQETERSVLAHFKDYQENIKFQYVLRLADMVGARLYALLMENFQGYSADLNQMVTAITGERSEKERLDSTLITIEREIAALKEQTQSTRQGIMQLRGSDSES
jgi:GTPase SAR1 family protein